MPFRFSVFLPCLLSWTTSVFNMPGKFSTIIFNQLFWEFWKKMQNKLSLCWQHIRFTLSPSLGKIGTQSKTVQSTQFLTRTFKNRNQSNAVNLSTIYFKLKILIKKLSFLNIYNTCLLLEKKSTTQKRLDALMAPYSCISNIKSKTKKLPD